MANDLNRWQGIGRLGKDVELRAMPSGKSVVQISLACGRSWKDKSTGEKQEETEWVNITAFDKLADIMAKYLTKGSQVFIEGRLKTDKWDKDGQTHYSTKVIADSMQMLGGKDGGKAGQGDYRGSPASQAAINHAEGKPADGFDDFDDDIPF